MSALIPRVVIVGGGFAGINAAKSLARAFVDVTIIDRRNFHLFQPLLYQVATAALNPSDIAFPIRSVFRGQRNVSQVLLGEVTRIDRGLQMVTLDDGSDIPYDYLLVATGATHSYFGNDQWAPLAPGLKTIEDALEIRRRVLGAFEQAELHPERMEELLTFVVVGAGPTGVELAGALTEIAFHVLADEFDHIDTRRAKVILVEGADHVLPIYPTGLSESARTQLHDLGVEVRLGSLVNDIDPSGVELTDGSRIPAATVLWAAGVQASSLATALETELDKAGRVLVADDLSLPDDASVFVAGDLAAVDGVPGVAPAAIQQGKHVARQIVADLAGRNRRSFRYWDKGSLATIGRARAVADIGPLHFGGSTAWVAWMAIHIFFLIGFRNRVAVFLSWAWSYLTFRRGMRIITGAVRAAQGDDR